jgi:hypothetical protein
MTDLTATQILEYVTLVRTMIMNRQGDVIDSALADERARNIVAAIMHRLLPINHREEDNETLSEWRQQ